MAKAKRKAAPGDLATNRQARFRYHLLDSYECGIMLTGTEVKSVRAGKVTLKDGFAAISDGEVWLHNVHISHYEAAARGNHEPERTRKLLLHKREIEQLIGKTRERGFTIVPTRVYISGARVKVEIALAKGKDVRDKRDTIRERDVKRELQRELRRR